MASCLYTCPNCEDYYLYAPNGLPDSVRDHITCSKCRHYLEVCRDQIKTWKLPPAPVERSGKRPEKFIAVNGEN